MKKYYKLAAYYPVVMFGPILTTIIMFIFGTLDYKALGNNKSFFILMAVLAPSVVVGFYMMKYTWPKSIDKIWYLNDKYDSYAGAIHIHYIQYVPDGKLTFDWADAEWGIDTYSGFLNHAKKFNSERGLLSWLNTTGFKVDKNPNTSWFK